MKTVQETFWHNYKTFRGQMRGMSLAEVRDAKTTISTGPLAIVYNVLADPGVRKAIAEIVREHNLRGGR